MTVHEFVSQLQDALDRAASRGGLSSKDIVITFIAPNSGFCGPTIRPRFMGYTEAARLCGIPVEARYGLTRSQTERILEAFNVTLPPKAEFA